MSRPRQARAAFQHFSLSATDEEWEVVRANAVRGRLSMARYLIELGLEEERAEEAGPSLALTPGEQGEVLEAMRVLPSLVGGGTGTKTLIEEMHDRVAVMFDAWAVEMARENRLEEVRASMSERVDASKAEEFLDRIETLAGAPAPRTARDPEPRSIPKGPPEQGTLNL